MTHQLDVPVAPTSPVRTTVVRTRSGALGTALLVGLLTGGTLGSLTFFGVYAVVAVSNGGVSGTDLAVVVVYGGFAFGAGAVTGLIQALVSVLAVLLLGVRTHLPRARVVGSLGALALPLSTIPGGWIPGILLPFAVASAASAACLMGVVTRHHVTVGR